jgi:hypothetical protein
MLTRRLIPLFFEKILSQSSAAKRFSEVFIRSKKATPIYQKRKQALHAGYTLTFVLTNTMR